MTNGEYLEFIHQGGYQQPALWLSDGWYTVQQEKWQAPLYWEKQENQRQVVTLSGMKALNLDEPVWLVSFFEADAYASGQVSGYLPKPSWNWHLRKCP